MITFPSMHQPSEELETEPGSKQELFLQLLEYFEQGFKKRPESTWDEVFVEETRPYVAKIKQLLEKLGDRAEAAMEAICTAWGITDPKEFWSQYFGWLGDVAFIGKGGDTDIAENRCEAFALTFVTTFKSFVYILSAPSEEELHVRANEINEHDIAASISTTGTSSMYRYMGHSYGLASYSGLRLQYHEPSQLSEEQKAFMRRMYENNYGQFDIYRHHLLEGLEKQFNATEGEFVFLQSKHPIGFIYLRMNNEEDLYLGSLNILQPFQQMFLVDPFIVALARDIMKRYAFERVVFTVVSGSKAEALYRKHLHAVDIPDTTTVLMDGDKKVERHQMEISRENFERVAYWTHAQEKYEMKGIITPVVVQETEEVDSAIEEFQERLKSITEEDRKKTYMQLWRKAFVSTGAPEERQDHLDLLFAQCMALLQERLNGCAQAVHIAENTYTLKTFKKGQETLQSLLGEDSSQLVEPLNIIEGLFDPLQHFFESMEKAQKTPAPFVRSIEYYDQLVVHTLREPLTHFISVLLENLKHMESLEENMLPSFYFNGDDYASYGFSEIHGHHAQLTPYTRILALVELLTDEAEGLGYPVVEYRSTLERCIQHYFEKARSFMAKNRESNSFLLGHHFKEAEFSPLMYAWWLLVQKKEQGMDVGALEQEFQQFFVERAKSELRNLEYAFKGSKNMYSYASKALCDLPTGLHITHYFFRDDKPLQRPLVALTSLESAKGTGADVTEMLERFETLRVESYRQLFDYYFENKLPRFLYAPEHTFYSMIQGHEVLGDERRFLGQLKEFVRLREKLPDTQVLFEKLRDTEYVHALTKAVRSAMKHPNKRIEEYAQMLRDLGVDMD